MATVDTRRIEELIRRLRDRTATDSEITELSELISEAVSALGSSTSSSASLDEMVSRTEKLIRLEQARSEVNKTVQGIQEGTLKSRVEELR